VSGFRWSFFEMADVNIGLSAAMIALFLGVCIAITSWMFKTGYRLKN
jgi:ABC-2 type transport system permease protein